MKFVVYNMAMENIIDSLNSHTNNEYKFSLKSALLKRDADFCVIEIFYKDGMMITPEKKAEFDKYVLSKLPKAYKYDLKFIKNYISEERIEGEVCEFMKKHFPSLSYRINSVKEDNLSFDINLSIDKLSYEHAKEKNLNGELVKFFKSLYEDYNFKCEYDSEEVYKEDEEELLKNSYKEEMPDYSMKRKIEVSEIVPIIGEELEPFASYIKDKTATENGIVVCGKVKSIKPIVIKKKPKQEKEQEETKIENQQGEEAKEKESATEPNNANESQEENDEIKYERKLYKFVIEDFTGQMSCVYFSNKETQAKVEKLDTDSVIIVRGNLEDDKFSGGLVLSVKDINYCTIPENLEEYIEYRKEKPFYEFVKPEKVVTYKQDDLMSFMEKDEVPEYLKGKTYVCYDFETTGLHYEKGDRIIEIGAVKIVDGKITERFMTYVDPEKPIPAESSAISGIIDEDVKGAPKDFEALQDFYKFTRGAILTGYNIINFDMVFLRGQGKNCRWNFDNEVEDVYRFAQKYVHGVKNYKLGTIAEKIGVVLDNAHRAVYDALATAEVFLKIAKDIK